MTYDVLIIGGGINGVGIAADTAGRGLSTLLCEMDDLASATSSNSSKLIHGGLRYLEHYEFRLVREALAEREVLLKKAPHIIWPLRFRLPHRPHLRPAWVIRLGLFLYDNLAKRATLKKSHSITFKDNSPLNPQILKGFEYSDAWVDDARLVVLNAMSAREKGAEILTRTRCLSAQRHKQHWLVVLENQLTRERQTIKAKTLVNAAGPWVTDFFDQALAKTAPKKIRLVKGSHIIVPRIYDAPEAYILQNEDKRIVFVIPYEEQFSLIGTTDVEHKGSPGDVEISQQEIDYLIAVVNKHFKNNIDTESIVSSYAGVRPLLDDDSDSPDKVTRDYTFEVDRAQGQALLLSIFGGKITTYRKLAEAAVNHIVEGFPHATPAWTANTPLPGGDFNQQSNLSQELQQEYPWLPPATRQRFVRSYGTLSRSHVLKNVNTLADMGQHFGAGLYQREIEYLIKQEWAITLEDIIWRRTKLGLLLNQSEQNHLNYFLQSVVTTPQNNHSNIQPLEVLQSASH